MNKTRGDMPTPELHHTFTDEETDTVEPQDNTCIECFGMGRVKHPRRMRYDPNDAVPCPRCNGTRIEPEADLSEIYDKLHDALAKRYPVCVGWSDGVKLTGNVLEIDSDLSNGRQTLFMLRNPAGDSCKYNLGCVVSVERIESTRPDPPDMSKQAELIYQAMQVTDSKEILDLIRGATGADLEDVGAFGKAVMTIGEIENDLKLLWIAVHKLEVRADSSGTDNHVAQPEAKSPDMTKQARMVLLCAAGLFDSHCRGIIKGATGCAWSEADSLQEKRYGKSTDEIAGELQGLWRKIRSRPDSSIYAGHTMIEAAVPNMAKQAELVKLMYGDKAFVMGVVMASTGCNLEQAIDSASDLLKKPVTEIAQYLQDLWRKTHAASESGDHDGL